MAVRASELTASLSPVVDLLRSHSACVLSGAGISTESGIPDYRGPERTGRPATPITLKEFLASEEARRRYWARSAIGWPWLESKEPNVGHTVVAALERSGICLGLITQNVDGLHLEAGNRAVVELHGALRTVVCLDCKKSESRYSLQERILVQNPGWMHHAGEVAPDGDVHLDSEITSSFRVPACMHCGGTIKPDVVFFGESVPATRVERAFSMLAQAEALIVLGSSLTVYSGYRFVVAAAKQKKPVVIVNDGPTRADAQATVKIEARLGEALASLGSTLDLV
ncbi:MAG: NAD-dependent protein deacetylase [Spirochaetota bacterium]